MATDLTKILAALNAQKPPGSPAQAPGQQAPPQIQPSYQGSYAIPTPPGNPSPYAVPKPVSSGSIDLSDIKPSNSGLVSLEDAVARARGIAAEKGISYDQGRGTPHRDSDSRRNLHRSRSRSRSPARGGRDSYNENYNPYRDERRDEARRPGASYPRERSFSPGMAQLQGRTLGMDQYPSRGYENRSPQPYGTDPGVETIEVESSLVGLIIGRQGENLRKVETETSTRVQFLTGPEATGPQRMCKITGTRAARDAAKAEIARIIEENGNPARGNVPPDRMGGAVAKQKAAATHQPALRMGEDSSQIMVPNRTVGLIIGKGGETIKDLQERSGCHVNITGEDRTVNGLRPVNLIGTPQAAAIAKELIMEIVDSDNKNLTTHGGPPNRAPGQGMPQYGAGDASGDRINDAIYVPSEAVGMIIGKGGETIKDLQLMTKCKINVAQAPPIGQDDIKREIALIGTASSIEHAKQAIMEKVRQVEEKNQNRTKGSGGGQNNNYSDRYSQPSQKYGTQTAAYNQSSYQYPGQGSTATGSGGAPANPAEGSADDPYRAYGGYQNYVAMYYAAYQAQQQNQQQGGQTPQGQ